MLSGSYSLQLGSYGLYATGFRDFANRGSTGVLVGLPVPLGGRSSASVSSGRQASSRNGQVQFEQSAISVGDVGYQGFASAGVRRQGKPIRRRHQEPSHSA